MDKLIRLTLRQARRLVVLVVGTTLLVVAGLLILLPGPPGWPLVPLGLAILATEFVWARRLLSRIKDGATEVVKGISGKRGKHDSQNSGSATCEADCPG